MNILLDHPGVLITEVLPLLHGFFDNEGWNDDLHRFCDHLLRTTFGEFDETVGIHYNFHVSKCNLFDTTCQVSDNFLYRITLYWWKTMGSALKMSTPTDMSISLDTTGLSQKRFSSDI